MLQVFNPATGDLVGQIPTNTPADVTSAIGRAHDAFPGWSARLARERSEILRRWHDLVKADKEEFAALMTRENGKCLTEARGEIDYGLGFIEWFAEEAKRIYGDTIPTHDANAQVLVFKQPVGVVGAITPWNFPFAMITRKIAPALAAGCTVVLKPAEDTPLTALKLLEYARKAGIPEGVLEMVVGDPVEIGALLTSDPRIAKISFTGSTAVGKLLVQQTANDLKKVTMELGGNSPFIVFDDADLNAALTGLINAKLRNAGQACVAANRIFIQRGVYDRFLDMLTDKAKNIAVDQGLQEEWVVGPLINQKGFDKVASLVESAKKAGGTVVLGGKPHARGGLFYEITILTDLKDDFDVACNEIFGPVFALYPFDTEDEVIKRANATPYGLASYVFTRDLGTAFRCARALESGNMIVNSGSVGAPSTPFGGMKHSGFGREGSHYGIAEYVDVKYVLMSGLGRELT